MNGLPTGDGQPRGPYGDVVDLNSQFHTMLPDDGGGGMGEGTFGPPLTRTEEAEMTVDGLWAVVHTKNRGLK